VSADFSCRATFQRCVAARQFFVDEQPEVSTPFLHFFIIFFLLKILDNLFKLGIKNKIK